MNLKRAVNTLSLVEDLRFALSSCRARNQAFFGQLLAHVVIRAVSEFANCKMRGCGSAAAAAVLCAIGIGADIPDATVDGIAAVKSWSQRRLRDVARALD